jgi:hypothetical protein
MSNAVTPKTPKVRISFVPVRAANKAVRKLVEDKVCQEVRRAINTWLYTQG